MGSAGRGAHADRRILCRLIANTAGLGMVEEICTVGQIRCRYEVTDIIDWILLHLGAKASNLSSTYVYEHESPLPPAVEAPTDLHPLAEVIFISEHWYGPPRNQPIVERNISCCSITVQAPVGQ
jgi:hypothetical protein